MASANNPPCPCGSGERYGACCRRYHRGEEPPDAPTLMRSRFAAFALGEVDYLWRTLHSKHPDRAGTPEAFVAELRRNRQSMKYVRLRVLDHDELPEAQTARVLFHAELYERGKERSFLELSTFEAEEGHWRYLSGEGSSLPAKAPELNGMKIRSFPSPGGRGPG